MTTELLFPCDGFDCAAAVNRECTKNGFGLSSVPEHQHYSVQSINQPGRMQAPMLSCLGQLEGITKDRS